MASKYALALLAAPAAAYSTNGQAFLGNGMQPEVVARTLSHVEDEWKAQAAVFAECDETNNLPGATIVNCADAPSSFDKSCKTVVGAIIQGSGGDKDVAKEYMADVCSEKTISGWHQTQCNTLAVAVQTSMSADKYANRESFDSSKLCTGFWSKFLGEEKQRQSKEKADHEAAEKQAAEEAAAEEKKAEEETKKAVEQKKVEEAQHAKEEAEKKAAEAAAKVAQKKAEAEAVQEAAAKKMAEAKEAEQEQEKAVAKEAAAAAATAKKEADEKVKKEADEKAKKVEAPKAPEPAAAKPAEVKPVVAAAKTVEAKPAVAAAAPAVKKF